MFVQSDGWPFVNCRVAVFVLLILIDHPVSERSTGPCYLILPHDRFWYCPLHFL